MHFGTLYPNRGVRGGFTVDVQLDASNFQTLANASEGDSVTVTVIAMKGYSGNPNAVFICKSYDQLFVEGAAMEDVSVTKVDAAPIGSSYADGNLYPERTKVTLNGIVARP